MEISKQACSLSLSKQLKEAGYKQEGIWWWTNKGNLVIPENLRYRKRIVFSCVAPTVAELGERLPNSVARGITFRLEFGKNPDNYSICYVPCGLGGYSSLKYLTDISEANARAKMWLYLKKEGLLND